MWWLVTVCCASSISFCRVLGFWRVQSPGRLSLCVNILSFCICWHITQSPPFLLLDERMHRSQNEGRHSCWEHKQKTKLVLSSVIRATLLQACLLRCSILLLKQTVQSPPALYSATSPSCASPHGRAELIGTVMSSALNCNYKIILMSVLLKPNDSMHINLKIDANALEPVRVLVE